MAINVAQFRADYPEFSSSSSYATSAIIYWLKVAYSLLNAERWGKELDIAVELYVAHNLAIEAKALIEARNSGIPGQQSGLISSKQVGPIAMRFDTQHTIEPGAGHWNLTIYGTRFYNLLRLFGAGPLQVGIGMVPPYSGLAWSGPLTSPGFANF